MAKGAPAQITIEGLREFHFQLKQMRGAMPTSLRKMNEEAAKRIVEAGREKARRPQQAKAAKSLRASRSGNFVAVMLGDNSRYEFAMGAEFGSRRYKQFPPWRGNQWQSWGGGPGYFLHPAIREVGEKIIDDYWESLRGLAHRAFPH